MCWCGGVWGGLYSVCLVFLLMGDSCCGCVCWEDWVVCGGLWESGVVKWS